MRERNDSLLSPTVRFSAGVCLGFVVLLLLVAAGCGSNGGGSEDWQTTTVGQTFVNIEGRILAPVSGSVRDSLAGLLSPSAGGGQANAAVFVEERPDLSAVTDGDGKFLIQNVPVGKWHLIAEIAGGGQAYRQRSDLVSVSSQYATWQLPSSLQLAYAARTLTLKILNRDSGAVVPGARVTLWGRSVTSGANGEASIGPVPSGNWQAIVSAAGYETRTFLFMFGDTGQTAVSVAMTPSASVNRNNAPTVELSATFSSLSTGGQGSLLATALDPDGDVVQFTWNCTAGSFSNGQGQSTLYTAPSASGTFVIEVTGEDGKGGTGKAAFTVYVADGSGGPVNPHNQAPLAATSPMPEDGATGQSVSPMLRWQASDPDGDALVYDVFLSKLGSPAVLIASNIANPYWQATGLSVYQDYIWHVICRDTSGAISSNYSQWQFKTGDGNNTPPYIPENPTPADQAQGQLPSILLTWIGGDPDPSDHVTYQLWLATGSQAPTLATTTSFPVARLENLTLGTTYSWKIVASDERAGVTTGPTWSFRTYDRPNNQPGDPVAVYPTAGASGVETRPQLRWDATEPDGDAMTYDVFLGTVAPLPCIASGVTYKYLLVPAVLKNNTNYSWQVVAKDTAGLTNANPSVWTFTTTVQANGAPLAPTLNTPANAAANVATQPTLSWTASDPDGDALTYDVFLGLNSTLSTPLVTGLTTPSYVPAALDAGQTYYWKVRASDGTASATSSTNRFTTLQAITADTTAPTLLSVVPAAGAAGVATGTSITFTFSEPMSQTSVENAVAFTPNTSYAKDWVTPSILRLTPTTPFWPGAYQIVSLANNSATDLALNKLITGVQAGFTMASDLALPTNYRSAGFPVTLSSGETAAVSVPSLGIGRYLLAAVVGVEATSSFQVSPNVVNQGEIALPDSFKTTPEAAIRELERRLALHGMPNVDGSGPNASVIASITVGDIRNFYITAYGSVATTTAYPNNFIKARCVGVSDQLYIYVDTSIVSPDYGLVSDIRLKFEEGIAASVRDAYGNEPAKGPDNDTHLTILLTNAMREGIIGLFYGADLYGNNPLDIQLRESNTRKIIYVRYSSSGLTDVVRYGTIAHEFQHMVNFYQKRLAMNGFEETWLAEGQAKYAEDIAGYGISAGDANTAQIIKMMQAQAAFNNMSLTTWYGIESYGLSYLFVRFLAEANRYGTTSREITRALSTSTRVGYRAIEAITNEPFSRTLGRFYLSLLLNRYTSTVSGDYGIKGLNLSGTNAGVQLIGMPVTTIGGSAISTDVKGHGCRYFRRDGNVGETTLQLQNVVNRVQAWLLDQRP